jgi:lipoyl(octanoyl) transferase
VEELICRLLPFESADGPTNMATDEVLLQAAIGGTATLRFYGWTVPTLTLGYFQSEKTRSRDPLLEPLPFVRRPSGGEILVHHHEVTYALGLPPGIWQPGRNWPLRMHQIIVAGLAGLSIQAVLQETRSFVLPKGLLCFRQLTPGDVLIAGAKVVGSARRKCRGAGLQHGGILLARSPHTPELSGIRELTGRDVTVTQIVDAVGKAFADATTARLVGGSLSKTERTQLDELRINKYGTALWNHKR